jgi:hypothetical protein
MLAPDDRALLLDALRAPAGARLERAVGTTFTLDLETALTVPLAFAGHSLRSSPDPVAVMESLRSTSSRLDIFCQAGAVVADRWPSDLVALLEPVVHEVPRPRPGHLFHPKVWAMHFSDEEGNDFFRVLVLSRNLTSDRSWDVLLRLDGEPARTINRDNEGLVRFISALPVMAKTALEMERRDAIKHLADHLRRVEWDIPEGATAVRFWPFGLRGSRRPDLDDLFLGYRHLVMSPFITPGGIDAVVRPMPAGSDVTIISRPEQLDGLPVGVLNDCSVHVISPLAGLEDVGEDASSSEGGAPFGALHAKVVVVEKNNRARLFLGSANATDAAYGGNVELLCELEGGPSKLGVALLMGDKVPFRGLLEPYVSPASPVTDDAAEAGRKLDAHLVDLAQLNFLVVATPHESLWQPAISTRETIPAAPHDATVWIAPFNRAAERVSLVSGSALDVSLNPRPGTELTPFLLLTARASVAGRSLERSTVVRAALVGGPSDRLDEILVRQIDTPEKFLRLLFLLLGFGHGAPGVELGTGLETGDGGAWHQADASGIFEVLVRALAIDPSSIDRLDEIVSRLGERPEGRDVLPAGWGDMWSTVREARGALVTKGRRS